MATADSMEGGDQPLPSPISNKRKRGEGGLVIEGRDEVKSITDPLEKIHKIADIWNGQIRDIPQKSCWEDSSRTFKNCVQPIMKCLVNHCGGDFGVFLEKWPDFTHSTFKKRCCKGKRNCGL